MFLGSLLIAATSYDFMSLSCSCVNELQNESRHMYESMGCECMRPRCSCVNELQNESCPAKQNVNMYGSCHTHCGYVWVMSRNKSCRTKENKSEFMSREAEFGSRSGASMRRDREREIDKDRERERMRIK